MLTFEETREAVLRVAQDQELGDEDACVQIMELCLDMPIPEYCEGGVAVLVVMGTAGMWGRKVTGERNDDGSETIRIYERDGVTVRAEARLGKEYDSYPNTTEPIE